MDGDTEPGRAEGPDSQFLEWSSTGIESDGHIRNTPYRPAIASGSLARIDGVFPLKAEAHPGGIYKIQDLSILVGGSPAKLTSVGPDSIVFQIPPAMKKLPRKKVLVQLCRGDTVVYTRVISIVAAAPAAYFPTGAFATPNAFAGKITLMPASGRGRQTSIPFSPGQPIRYSPKQKLLVGILITGVDLQTNAGSLMQLFVNDKRVKSTLAPALHLGRQILQFDLGPEWLKTDDLLRIDFDVDGCGMEQEFRPLLSCKF
jgi:hypothetical protein